MQGERSYTSLEEALRTLSGALASDGRRETVNVRRAYGRVLWDDVRARQDVPPWDVSHFDGFALLSADTAGATDRSPRAIRLVGSGGRPGVPPRRALRAGEAMEVLTGGPLPKGADTVIAVEDVVEAGGEILVSTPVGVGEHVYRRGADVKKGEKVLRAGRTLMGQDMVLLASLRIGSVPVFKKPSVAVIPTGTELTNDKKGGRGKVIETHSLLLERLIEGAGGIAHTLPIVPDDLKALIGSLRKALDQHEMALTLAGSSVGEPDLVESAIRAFGKETTALVHGVRVNRGRVMGFAVVRAKPVLILPGPIQGALNAFIVFAYPLIRRHLGRGMEQPPALAAKLAEGWEARGKFRGFDQIVYLTLARDTSRPGEFLATPSGAETENVSFLVSKNAYALIPGGIARLEKGMQVQAHLLPGFSRLE